MSKNYDRLQMVLPLEFTITPPDQEPATVRGIVVVPTALVDCNREAFKHMKTFMMGFPVVNKMEVPCEG